MACWPLQASRGCRLQSVLRIQVVLGLPYGIRRIIDGAAVLLFVWTARRVGVAAGFIQTD